MKCSIQFLIAACGTISVGASAEIVVHASDPAYDLSYDCCGVSKRLDVRLPSSSQGNTPAPSTIYGFYSHQGGSGGPSWLVVRSENAGGFSGGGIAATGGVVEPVTGLRLPLRLSAGAVVGPNLTFDAWVTPSGVVNGFSPMPLHSSLGDDGYFGIKFQMNGSTHYGWVRYVGDNGTIEHPRFISWAYETIPNQPVVIGLTCDSIDFNNDSSTFDPQDIDAFLSVYAEGSCIPTTATCNDIDFNNDTSLFDPCDINSFLVMYSEGPCTACGQ